MDMQGESLRPPNMFEGVSSSQQHLSVLSDVGHGHGSLNRHLYHEESLPWSSKILDTGPTIPTNPKENAHVSLLRYSLTYTGQQQRAEPATLSITIQCPSVDIQFSFVGSEHFGGHSKHDTSRPLHFFQFVPMAHELRHQNRMSCWQQAVRRHPEPEPTSFLWGGGEIN